MTGRNIQVSRNILSQINDLYLIHMSNLQRCPLFRRTGHPINIFRKKTSTVSFNADVTSRSMQSIHQSRINPQARLSPCKNHHPARILFNSFHNFPVFHLCSFFMARITKVTFQITSRKTDKYSRSACMISFSLQAVENLINLFHKRPYFLPIHILQP